MKIMIVDDSAFMRAILKGIILKSKWSQAEIVEASDGNDAVQKFQAVKPNLMLLDIVMPDQDGIGVLRQIGHAAEAIVIVSSVDQTDIIDEAKKLGAKDYITKPFDADAVLQVLNNMTLQREE